MKEFKSIIWAVGIVLLVLLGAIYGASNYHILNKEMEKHCLSECKIYSDNDAWGYCMDACKTDYKYGLERKRLESRIEGE